MLCSTNGREKLILKHESLKRHLGSFRIQEKFQHSCAAFRPIALLSGRITLELSSIIEGICTEEFLNGTPVSTQFEIKKIVLLDSRDMEAVSCNSRGGSFWRRLHKILP